MKKTAKGIKFFVGIIQPGQQTTVNITEQQFVFILERCYDEFLESWKCL